MSVEPVQVGAVLAPQLEHVAEALGGDQAGACAGALQERVRAHGHAVAEARDVRRPQEVTRPILERYLRHLYHRRKEDGRALSATAQLSAIGAVRAYFRWLNKQNVLLWNPASDLELPRVERR